MSLPTPELVRAPQAVPVAQSTFTTDVQNWLNVSESVNLPGIKCDFSKLSPTSVTSSMGHPNSPGNVPLSTDFGILRVDETALTADHVGHIPLYSSNDLVNADGQQRYQISEKIKLPTKEIPSTVRSRLFSLRPMTKPKPEILPKEVPKDAIPEKNKFRLKIECSVTRGSTDVTTAIDLCQAIGAEEEISINGERVQVSSNTSEWTTKRILLMQDWPVSLKASLILFS